MDRPPASLSWARPTPSFWLFVARTIDGIFGANISAAQAYVADVTPSEKRSRALGWLGAAFGLGFICGPLLGGILAKSPCRTVLFCQRIGSSQCFADLFRSSRNLANRGPGASCLPRPSASVGTTQSRMIGSVIGSYFFFMTGFAILTSFFAIFTEDRFGFDASQNGYIFAGIGAIGSDCSRRPSWTVVSRFGEKRLATVGVALLADQYFQPPADRTDSDIAPDRGFIGVGNALVNPTMSGLVSQRVDKYHQGRVLGLMQSAASLGRCLGPILGGLLVFLERSAHPDSAKPLSGPVARSFCSRSRSLRRSRPPPPQSSRARDLVWIACRFTLAC